MRKSKQEAAQTRERIVRAAAGEFRQHGIVATGLSDLMAAAGLTHGGFYRHFESKDQIVTEASSIALAALGSELARADAETRNAATAGFLRLVDIVAGQLDQTQPAEAKKRAIVAVATMIGALTMSRIVTDEAISKTILRAAEESLTRS